MPNLLGLDTVAVRDELAPDRIGLFAGAVKYREYDPKTRKSLKRLAMFTRLDTDTSR